jgi:hypothetical protein
MQVPFLKEMRIGAYILKQKLQGRKRYPLVLMLEPLFRCNLACVGCGKIDYPDAILNRRLSVQQCLDAVDECGAPMVAIPGGEPLIHREIGEEAGIPSYLIADGSELAPQWVQDAHVIGITAGASAPEVLVDDVINTLRTLGEVEVSTLPGRQENIEFRLPRELATS